MTNATIIRWLNGRIEESEAKSQDHEMMQEEYMRAKEQLKKHGTLPRYIRTEFNKSRRK